MRISGYTSTGSKRPEALFGPTALSDDSLPLRMVRAQGCTVWDTAGRQYTDLLMALGAVAIALSSATEREHASWQDAAAREGQRYGIADEYVRAGLEGREFGGAAARTFLDWLLILGTTTLFVALALMARAPHLNISTGWAAALVLAMLSLLASCGIALWRTTRFR